MKIATATHIKQVENTPEILNEFVIEIDLENILLEELEIGLSSDINSMV